MKTIEPSSDMLTVRVADFLNSEKDSIISEWLEQIHKDPAILPTETLNVVALKNHFPKILDDLADTLRSNDRSMNAKQTLRDAEDHGATRLFQGYQLPEMLREIKHLRAIYISRLRIFEDSNPDFGIAHRLFVSSILHRFLDDLAIDATTEYLWSELSMPDRLARGYCKKY